MLLYVPGYKYHRVTNFDRDPILDVIHGLILHETGTNVSPLEFFDGPSAGIESTLYLPKRAAQEKQQYRPLNREADANFRANSWIQDGKRHGFLSLETQGVGDEPWTPYQLDEIKDLILFLSKNCAFPMQVPQRPKGKGVGYHTQFPSWSNVPGKICPGAGKKKQYYEIIVPWMQQQNDAKKYYVVKPGDTILSISKKLTVAVWKLWLMNPDINLPVKTGDILRVKE